MEKFSNEILRKKRANIYLCCNCGKWERKENFANLGLFPTCSSCANAEIEPKYDNVIKVGRREYVVRPIKNPDKKCLDCALYDDPKLCEKYDCTNTYLRHYNAKVSKEYLISSRIDALIQRFETQQEKIFFYKLYIYKKIRLRCAFVMCGMIN